MRAFKKWCPNCTVAIDPFHYVRYVVRAIEAARIKAMGKFDKKSVAYKILKKHRRLLLSKEDPNRFHELINVRPLNAEMTRSELIQTMLSFDEALKEGYELGHSFLANLDTMDFDSFGRFLQLTIERFKFSSIEEFRDVGNTFSNWRDEIRNSYIVVPGFGRLNNSVSEGSVNKIKTLKKVSYGITNFDHLRKRIFLIFGSRHPRK